MKKTKDSKKEIKKESDKKTITVIQSELDRRAQLCIALFGKQKGH